MPVSMIMARRLTAIIAVVVMMLQHDLVRGQAGQGGREAELQRRSGRLDMSAWVQDNGGKVGWMVGPNPQGFRGALATHSYQPGDIISIVPRNCTFDLGPQEWTAPELAVNLMGSKFGHPAKWSFMAPYRQSLPDSFALYGKYTFIQEHLSLLQDDSLADMAIRMHKWLVGVFEGGDAVSPERTLPTLMKAFPEAAQLPFSDLRYWTAVIDMYSFSFQHPVSKDVHRFLLPAMDMVNHDSDANAEVRITSDGELFAARALKHIKAREEVTHRYSWSIERNDKALMNYFFVHQRSPPRLCSVDLPGGSIWDEKDHSLPEDDVGSPDGIPISKEEAERLRTILEAFSTTEEEDRATLANGGITDWRERTIIDFRIRRKEALRLAIERIEAALGSGKAAEGGAVSSENSATNPESSDESAQSSAAESTSGDEYAAQNSAEDSAADKMPENVESDNAVEEPLSVEASSDEELGAEEGLQESEQTSDVKRKAVVQPVDGASEGLQEPKFIKIGSAAVDEL